jgi:acetyltransferase-like isoleucine patch superfamily enzyme
MTLDPTSFRTATEDPLSLFSRAATKLHTLWLRKSYPFAAFGERVSVHYSCDIYRPTSKYISVGDQVYLAPDVWLNVECGNESSGGPKLILGKGCKIGRRSTISSRNYILLEDDVLLAPSVLIMDHNHDYSDPNSPIHAQGVTAGGRITIGRNCWLGHGCVIFAGTGELCLGQNTVVGANAVVTKSFPPYSVVAGNPAEIIKQFDQSAKVWVRVNQDRTRK